jgi:protein TonB
LPTEAGGQSQPIREEGRTVIVFDNGAVLRCKNNLPLGQTVILSNPSGRDVVCRVVAGNNIPSVKGYVEVEFMEAVNDFWRIHQDANSGGAALPQPSSPMTPAGLRESPVAPPAAPPRVNAPIENAAKPSGAPLGSGPSFADIAGLVDTTSSATATSSTPDFRNEAPRPAPPMASRNASDYSHSEVASPTELATWGSTDSQAASEKHAASGSRDSWPATSAPARDFMSKGLMAYEKPASSATGSMGKTPLIVGGVAIALVAVSGIFFFTHRSSAPGNAPVSVASTQNVAQPAAPNPPAEASAPAASARGDATASTSPSQLSAQPVAMDQAPVSSALAPVPAVATAAVGADSGTDSPNPRRQDKKSVVSKQPEPVASKRPTIPNLKLGSPTAPIQKPADMGQGNAPMTDISAVEPIAGTTPAGLLTAAGRTSNQPAPPPSAPAPPPVAAAKVVHEPKMISSVGIVYPPTAKQSSIQGSVTVSATVNESGKVVSATAVSGPLLLRQAAVDSVKQWKYLPGTVDGKPTTAQVNVRVDFHLN